MEKQLYLSLAMGVAAILVAMIGYFLFRRRKIDRFGLDKQKELESEFQKQSDELREQLELTRKELEEANSAVAASGARTSGESREILTKTRPSEDRVVLRNLKLQNIRSFESLDLEFSAPQSTGAGQWTILLGDNGVGKSTILRSIVLGIGDPEVSSALLQTQKSPAPFVRRGADEGRIEVSTASNQKPYAVRLEGQSTGEGLKNETSRDYSYGVFAYGPLRGSALGGSAREVSFSALGTVATLFDEGAHLIHAETWLGKCQLAALQSKGGADESFFEAVLATMRDLLPGVDRIEVTASGVAVWGAEVGEGISLAGMSDGYVGTIGWVLDLMARWSDRHQKISGRPPDGSIAKSMKGLVIVDELGLHLHPRWQTTVIKDLRARFPQMSFLVSSHQPLLLLGAQEGEIHVLRRDTSTNNIKIEQANIPPGASSDQILTGRWFNLPSTLDDGTKKLLEEHRQLLRAGKDESNARVTALQNILRDRLGSFADTSMDRMALTVAAQVIREDEKNFDEVSAERKEQIREEMLVELRARVEKQEK